VGTQVIGGLSGTWFELFDVVARPEFTLTAPCLSGSSPIRSRPVAEAIDDDAEHFPEKTKAPIGAFDPDRGFAHRTSAARIPAGNGRGSQGNLGIRCACPHRARRKSR